jgi:DNA polymerase III subunit gamma/tau
MSETFYRKYRPAHFSEVIGQEMAVAILTESLLQNKLAHAYLLSGPRGTGKTTLARLFAQAVNCRARAGAEPCGRCEHCRAMEDRRTLDVIEIDAASHTGVDNIRELRDTISAAPTLGSHKIYIIDEAHMLSLGAWNALLKTLEEPPQHVIFILATTNPHKVPETILSRTLRLDLRRFPVDRIVEKLVRIAKNEKIKIEKAALTQIARAAQGGMRDAEVLFTQIATLEESPIDAERVALLLGTTTIGTNHELLAAIAADDLGRAFAAIGRLRDAGSNLSHFTVSLLEYLRQALYVAIDPEHAPAAITDLTETERAELVALALSLGAERIVECMERFQEADRAVKVSPIPDLPLQIAVVKLIRNHSSEPPAAPPTPKTGPSEKVASGPALPHPPKPAAQPKRPAPLKQVASSDLGQTLRHWPAIMKHAIELNASLGVALSTATLATADGRLSVQVHYPFHQKQLEKETNRLTLDQAFVTILGFQPPWTVSLEPKDLARAVVAERPAIIDQALSILGGKLAQEHR